MTKPSGAVHTWTGSSVGIYHGSVPTLSTKNICLVTVVAIVVVLLNVALQRLLVSRLAKHVVERLLVGRGVG